MQKTYDRFLKKMDNAALKEIMTAQVKKLYKMGIVDASFIGLDSTPVAANTNAVSLLMIRKIVQIICIMRVKQTMKKEVSKLEGR